MTKKYPEQARASTKEEGTMKKNDKKQSNNEVDSQRRNILKAGGFIGATSLTITGAISTAIAAQDSEKSKAETTMYNRTSNENLFKLALSRLNIPPGTWDDFSQYKYAVECILTDDNEANVFLKNPSKYLESKQITGIKLDSAEVKMLLAICNPDVKKAIATKNTAEFLRLLYESDLLKKCDTSYLKEKVQCTLDKYRKKSGINNDEFNSEEIFTSGLTFPAVAFATALVFFDWEFWFSGDNPTGAYFKIDQSTCIECGACVAECSVNAIWGGGPSGGYIISDQCIGCGDCLFSCPVNAIGESSGAASISAYAETSNLSQVAVEKSKKHRSQIKLLLSGSAALKHNPSLSLAEILGDSVFFGQTTWSYVNNEVDRVLSAIEEIEIISGNPNFNKEELRTTLINKFEYLLMASSR